MLNEFIQQGEKKDADRQHIDDVHDLEIKGFWS